MFYLAGDSHFLSIRNFPFPHQGRIFGVSRMLSGSHLMAHVFADQQGDDGT